jgi:hypothetical protein
MLCYIAVDVVINSTNENRLSGTQYGHDDKDCGKSQGQPRKTFTVLPRKNKGSPMIRKARNWINPKLNPGNEALSPFFFHHLRRTLECSDRTEIFVSDHRYYKKK